MALWVLLCSGAVAGPPAEQAPLIEVVSNQAAQGTFKFVLEGREGDAIRVDGWPFGVLPLETELAEGLHTFKVEGTAGILEVVRNLVVSADSVTQVDLAAVVPADPDAPVASIQGDKPALREAIGKVKDIEATPEPEPEPAPEE